MVELRANSWILVKGKLQSTICTNLDLRAGMSITRPRRFPIEGAASDSGWYLILAQGRDHRLVADQPMTKPAGGCEALTCTVDEGALYSAATGWRDGRKLWSAVYDGMESTDLAIEGELPAWSRPVLEAQRAKAALPDAGDLLLDPIFEVPIELVRSATGFRPDEKHPAFDGRFVVLEAENPSFMQRLFGG